jgi:hypothetical protein
VLTDPGKLERHLGALLTASQIAEAHAVCLAVGAWVTATYGFSDTPGAVTEQHEPAPVIYTRRAPITSVTSVSTRSGITATPVALVAGTDYEIINAAQGMLSLPGIRYGWPRNYAYDRVTVVYTPDVTVAAYTEQGATMLAAHWFRRHSEGIAPGIKSFNISGELQVTYADAAAAYGIPAEVTRLLAPLGRLVLA